MNGGRRRGRLCELPQIPIALKNESRFGCQRDACVDNVPPGKVQGCSAVLNLPRNAEACSPGPPGTQLFRAIQS